MSTTDVHRLIDSKLPEGKTCTAVSMYLVYTAIIDGNPVIVSVEPDLREEDIAIRVITEVGTAENAAMEGDDAPDEDEPEEEAAPKAKTTKRKK